eukprot:5373863-Amphidinium_carterae.1
MRGYCRVRGEVPQEVLNATKVNELTVEEVSEEHVEPVITSATMSLAFLQGRRERVATDAAVVARQDTTKFKWLRLVDQAYEASPPLHTVFSPSLGFTGSAVLGLWRPYDRPLAWGSLPLGPRSHCLLRQTNEARRQMLR